MPSKNSVDFDVIVVGTGLVGLLSASAFVAKGFRVALVGPAANLGDSRTTAVMTPGLEYLDSLSLLAPLRSDAAPLRVMRIVDATRRLIRSPVVTFRASEIGAAEFGLNIPNRNLNEVLDSKVRTSTGITRYEGFVASWKLDADGVVAVVDGVAISARLAVAADGRNSAARRAAGISADSKAHDQSALALTFSHSRPHSFISTEFHTEHGPFTQVPLSGDRSSLVWVAERSEAERLALMALPELSRRIEERMQSMLGRVEADTAPQVYPLSQSLPDAFARNRVALVGEAAHTFPPIGAQGLNLGIRDVEQLVAIAAENRDDPGNDEAMRSYERQRRPDIIARAGAVGLLNSSLLSNMLPAQIARSAGLGLLGSFAPLRAFLMREGLRRGSGFSSAFSAVRPNVDP